MIDDLRTLPPGTWLRAIPFAAIAALLIGISQISIYIGFETRAGLYYFAAGVLLNNLATMKLTYRKWPSHS